MKAIRQLSMDQVKAADQDPVYFFYPYARLILLEHYVTFRKEYDLSMTMGVGNALSAKRQLFQIQFDLTSLSSIEREVVRVCHILPQSQTRSQFETLSKDISSLKTSYETSAADY